MIDSKSGVFVTITNNNDYTLTMEKTKCDKPDDLYEIKLTRRFKNDSEIEELFYMNEVELSYFARALLI